MVVFNARPSTTQRFWSQGFTLLELLMVIAVIGILSAIAVGAYSRWQQRVSAEDYLQGFTADLNSTRSRVMATGIPHRIVLNTTKQYSIERWVSPSWVNVLTRTSTRAQVALTGAKQFTYDSRGFMTATTAANQVTTNTNLTADLGTGQTRTIIVTALGTARAF